MPKLSKKQNRTRQAPRTKQPAIGIDIPAVPYKIGYARVSTEDQNLDMQIAALEKVGCDLLFTDIMSAGAKRPEFHQALKQLQPGDTLYVYAISRLHRNTKHLLDLFDTLEEKGVKLVSLTEHIDVTTATGRMHATILAAVDEHEKGRIGERTKDGMAQLKAKGIQLGRPRKISDKIGAQISKELEYTSPEDLAKKYRVSVSTIYKYRK